MGINQIFYGDKELINLINDTVDSDNLLVGNTAHDRRGEIIEGSCTFDADTSDANAKPEQIKRFYSAYVQGKKVIGTCTHDSDTRDATAKDVDILEGKTAYVKAQKITGLMKDFGSTNRVISTKNQTLYLREGHYDESTVKIKSEAVQDLVPENLIESATILGVKGSITDHGTVNKTISTKAQEIILENGYYESGSIKIDPKAVNDLKAENMLESSTVLGVKGSIKEFGSVSQMITTKTQEVTIGKGHHNESTIKIDPKVVVDLSPENFLQGKSVLGINGGIKKIGTFDRKITTKDQEVVIEKGYYENGIIKIDPEAVKNLKAENIHKSVTILGVTGTLNNTTEGTQDGNITASDVVKGKIGYAKGVKITGTVSEVSANVLSVKTIPIIDTSFNGGNLTVQWSSDQLLRNKAMVQFQVPNMSAIKAVLKPENIKKGVTIPWIKGTSSTSETYSVTGTLEPGPKITRNQSSDGSVHIIIE